MVGDKAFAFLLMDRDMYDNMSDLKPATATVERGIALHKVWRGHSRVSLRELTFLFLHRLRPRSTFSDDSLLDYGTWWRRIP